MKIFKINIFLIMILLTSCNNFKDKALFASNEMIKDYIHNNENIKKYFYKPAENIVYSWLNIYDEQYGGNDFFGKYIEIKNRYGNLLNYNIIQIRYKHEYFPFYDYGYPYCVEINLKCYYKNIITEENISGYYIKEINKINIVSYWIKEINE